MLPTPFENLVVIEINGKTRGPSPASFPFRSVQPFWILLGTRLFPMKMDPMIGFKFQLTKRLPKSK
jgi:hypothetical protein